jgi:hypothetical protein
MGMAKRTSGEGQFQDVGISIGRSEIDRQVIQKLSEFGIQSSFQKHVDSHSVLLLEIVY